MDQSIPRNIMFRMLDDSQLAKIHEKSMEIIEHIGMRFDGERSIALLKKAGAAVEDGNLVKIPGKLVESALKSVPKSLTLYSKTGEKVMQIDSAGQCYFGTHSDQLEYVDPLTDVVRPFVKADIQSMCKIANAMKNIYFVLSVGMTRDVDPRVQTYSTFIETLRHFNKTINFSTNNSESLKDCIAIAADFAGGLKALQEKPFVFNYCEPIPPLTHPSESTEKIFISAENRIPFVYMPYCMMGGTSPMAGAASLVQCNAEALGGLVLTQLVSDGAPFIYGAMPSILDMKTTVGSYGAPEFHRNIAAMSEIAAGYGIPFYGTAGCSDAKHVDPQSVFEMTFQVMSTMLSKANIVHDVGILDHCNSVSPEIVVLADEIIENLKHFTNGISTAEEDFALDTIREVGQGGHFLSCDHTLDHYREVWYPQIFSRSMQSPDKSEVLPKVKERIRNILETEQPTNCDKQQMSVLCDWERKLGIL